MRSWGRLEDAGHGRETACRVRSTVATIERAGDFARSSTGFRKRGIAVTGRTRHAVSHTHQAKRLPECRAPNVGGGWVSVARGPVPIGHTLSRNALCQGDARFTCEPSARGRRGKPPCLPWLVHHWVSFGRRALFFVAPRSSRSQKADTEVCPYTKTLPQFRQ